MQSLENQINGEFPDRGFVEVLLGVRGLSHSLRVCIAVKDFQNKIAALRRADSMLPELLGLVPKITSLAEREGERRFAKYCAISGLRYEPPSIWGLWINPNGSANYQCGFFGDLDGQFIDVVRSPAGVLTVQSSGPAEAGR